MEQKICLYIIINLTLSNNPFKSTHVLICKQKQKPTAHLANVTLSFETSTK